MEDRMLTRREAVCRFALSAGAAVAAAASDPLRSAFAVEGVTDVARRDTWSPGLLDPSTTRLLLPGWLEHDGVLVRFDGGRVGAVRSNTWKVDHQTHNETLVELPGAKPGRLLVWCRGYAMHAAELTADQIAGPQPIRLPMKRLPATVLAGRLLDSERQPVAGKHLALTYRLQEAMAFFGYIDGPVDVVKLATDETAADGSFRFSVPTLSADPFLGWDRWPVRPALFTEFGPPAPSPREERKEPRRPLAMRLQEVGDVTRTLSPAGYVEAVTVAAAAAYPEPLTMRLRYPGTLYGRLSEAHLKKFGLSGSPARYLEWEAMRDERIVVCLTTPTTAPGASRYLYPRPDGGLSEGVPAGTYGVDVRLTGGKGRVLAVLHERLEVTERASIRLDFG